MWEFSCYLVVISFNEMDCLRDKSISIRFNVLGPAQTEISEEIERVRWLHTRIQTVNDDVVHLLGVCKWAVAVTNNVEVPKVKVGGEPGISHLLDYAASLLKAAPSHSPRTRRSTRAQQHHRAGIQGSERLERTPRQ